MYSILKCPRCLQLVSGPEGVGLDAPVRCPLCRAEYPLRDALPPALIPVGGPAAPVEGSAATGAPVAGAAAATAEVAPTAAEAAPADREVGVGAFSGPAEAADTAEGAPGEAGRPAAEPEQPAETEQPVEAEQPAGAAGGEGGMFDFLHGDGTSAAAVAEETDDGSKPMIDTDEPSFAGFRATADRGDASAPSSMAARPRRKEKNVARELLGAVIGGVVGLSIGYYGLNFFGGDQFDFLNVWLPGVGHTQEHWPGGTGEEAQPGDLEAQADAPVVYPAPPRPDGALLGGVSRHLDINFEHLIAEGRIRPESGRPLVAVNIDGEEHLTAPEGEIIVALEDVHIGGATVREGDRLKRQAQWWIDFGEAEAEPDPVEVAEIDLPIELEPLDLPGMEPEPEEAALRPGYVGPKHRASYDGAQLGAALKAAHSEFEALGEQDALSDSFYEALCELAERLTFVEPEAAGLFDRQLAAEIMLERLSFGAGRIGEIAAASLARLDDPDTASGGIVLAGTAGREVERDGLYGTMLAMPGAQTPYNVLSDKPLGVEEGDTVVVAGVAVTNPSENLVGYPGSRPVVIWSGLTVRLPELLDAPDEPPTITPAEEAPVEEAPVEEPPVEEDVPVEEAPAEEAPAEETPAEETPAEEAPVDG